MHRKLLGSKLEEGLFGVLFLANQLELKLIFFYYIYSIGIRIVLVEVHFSSFPSEG